MPAIAMTDHGNLFGAVEFYQAAQKAGVKPIIGCEVYVAPGSMHEKSSGSARDAANHLTLLAETNEGYRNLVKLVSAAWLEGFYYKPRIDHDLLAKHAKGLIALSGCLKGEVNQHLEMGQVEKARETVALYRDILGKESYFIELHDHGIEAQRRCMPHLLDFAKEFDLATVATNDAHFLEREHHEAHDVMICIGTGSMVHDEKRLHYVPEVYLKSPQEMRALFADHPEACDQTLEIAERCNVEMEFGELKYPVYEVPHGTTHEQYLRDLCEKGLVARFGEEGPTRKDLRERLETELGIIEGFGYVSYFLIVWDFINYARSEGIPVGPGRGSAAGSLLAYLLGITDVDPLRYSLFFERFLNPERVSPPDIDIDFCINRRDEVIEYVRQKYGVRAVSQIVTFGTLGAKSVVRDVARVLGLSYGDGDRIAKMIPNELNITLEEAAKKSPELARAIEDEPSIKQLWDYALVLEGLTRGTGIHAAGVVIGDRDLDEFIPLCRGKEDEVVTQFPMNALTDLGMLKMDFLGLKNLTVIYDTVALIQKKKPDFNISEIPLDDQKAFDLYNRGETLGLFQVEGVGMTAACRKFDIQRIEDIIAILALYRPGPMDLIDDYIERKKGRKKVVYAHPLLEKCASETYGIMIYQEQVMAAANLLAGYTLGEADMLRRAMGKKDREKMAKERAKFIRGAREKNDIDEQKANEVFDLLEKFAGYGFNKSHSAAYGLVSYQTAYLKANFPVEFMAALLSSEYGNTEKIGVLVAECSRMGIDILPPDVNRSRLKFQAEPAEGGLPAIRFGLSAIKNVGGNAMVSLIKEREENGPYESLDDFCKRLDSRMVNRKVLEALVKCGAFDFLGVERAEVFADIEPSMNAAVSAHRDRASGQVSLFDDLEVSLSARPTTRKVEPWPRREMLAYEKELLGFYVTGHPLDEYLGSIERGNYTRIADLKDLPDGRQTLKFAGLVQTLERRYTKKDGKPFVTLSFEDLTGTVEMNAWSEAVERCGDVLQVGSAVAVSASVSKSEDNMRISINTGKALRPRPSRRPVRLRLDRTKVAEEDLSVIAESVARYPGKRPLVLEFVAENGAAYEIEADGSFNVGDERSLRGELIRYLENGTPLAPLMNT